MSPRAPDASISRRECLARWWASVPRSARHFRVRSSIILDPDKSAPSSSVPSAAAHALADDLANDRQGFSGSFLWPQGGICDIAHQPCDVVIDLLLRPDLALCHRYIDRIGVMNRSRPFANDVENPSETVGVRELKERLAETVADA